MASQPKINYAKAAENPAVQRRIEEGISMISNPCILNLDLIHDLVRMYKENVGENDAVTKYGRNLLQTKIKNNHQEKLKWATAHTQLFFSAFKQFRAKILSGKPEENFSWLDQKISLTFGKQGAAFPISILYQTLKDPSKDEVMVRFEELMFKIFQNCAESNGDEEAKENLANKLKEYSGGGQATEDGSNLSGLVRTVRTKVLEEGLTDDTNMTLADMGQKVFPIAMGLLQRGDVQQAIQGVVNGIQTGGFDPSRILNDVGSTVKKVNEEEEVRDEQNGTSAKSAAAAAASSSNTDE